MGAVAPAAAQSNVRGRGHSGSGNTNVPPEIMCKIIRPDLFGREFDYVVRSLHQQPKVETEPARDRGSERQRQRETEPVRASERQSQ